MGPQGERVPRAATAQPAPDLIPPALTALQSGHRRPGTCRRRCRRRR